MFRLASPAVKLPVKRRWTARSMATNVFAQATAMANQYNSVNLGQGVRLDNKDYLFQLLYLDSSSV